MKKNRTLIMVLIATIFMTAIGNTTAFAATKNEPYGYTYDDSATYRTVYRYYSWDSKAGAYAPTREFYSKGTYMYTVGGKLILNQTAGSGSKTNGFDKLGNFFIIGNDGSLSKITTSNQMSTVLESGAIRLNYTDQDLAFSVSTNSGSLYLSNLKPAPEVDDDDDYTPPTVEKSQNRVEIYTNSAGETVYDGYSANKIKTKIIVSSDGLKVLNATAKVRLTDTLKGAKFIGFDRSYNVYLYEGGTLYRFKSGKWYSAEKLVLSGQYRTFKKDDDGFISKVVTSKNSYTIKQLTSSGKWKASKTYAVHKKDYVTLYVKGRTSSYTLMLNSGKLKLNGKKIASNVSKYGFIGAKKLIYIKKGVIYSAKLSLPKKATKICKGKALKTNSVGLVTKVSSGGKWKKVS